MKSDHLKLSKKVLVCLTGLFMFLASMHLSAQTENTDSPADQEVGVFNTSIRRVDRPFHLEFGIVSGGYSVGGVSNPGASLHIGYQFSKLMYLGITSQTFYDGKKSWDWNNKSYYDDETVYGQDGVKESTLESDPRHLIAMRFFPFNFGLYFSGGIMISGKQKSVVEYKTRSRTINENEYTAGPIVTTEYKAWTGAATGIGFNQIFENGLSLTTSLNVGLGVQTPDITIKSDVAIRDSDLEEWTKQIEHNERRVPVMFMAGIGYAF